MNGRTIFLDVNIPMYAAGAPHLLRESCTGIMTAIAAGELMAVIDVEIVQEILHRYGALGNWPIAVSIAENVMAIIPLILPVTVEDIALTVEMAASYGPKGVKARDLIHAAVMRNNGIDTIVSADTHFDSIDGIDRISPQSLFTDLSKAR